MGFNSGFKGLNVRSTVSTVPTSCFKFFFYQIIPSPTQSISVFVYVSHSKQRSFHINNVSLVVFAIKTHSSKWKGLLVGKVALEQLHKYSYVYTFSKLTHCGRVTQICVFNTVKLGTSASSP